MLESHIIQPEMTSIKCKYYANTECREGRTFSHPIFRRSKSYPTPWTVEGEIILANILYCSCRIPVDASRGNNSDKCQSMRLTVQGI